MILRRMAGIAIAAVALGATVIATGCGQQAATPTATPAVAASPTRPATTPTVAASPTRPAASPTTAAPAASPTTAAAATPTTAAPAASPTTAAATPTRPPATPTTAAPPAGGPPNIPHTLQGREGQCTTCHTIGGAGVGAPGGTGLPSSHQGRTSDVCLSCHKTA
ncbi:MAG: hypothetical protein HYX94_10155 [Chloroflexi bacterium]|nr:hypothetical protein [Chloroflexota bacterium]